MAWNVVAAAQNLSRLTGGLKAARKFRLSAPPLPKGPEVYGGTGFKPRPAAPPTEEGSPGPSAEDASPCSPPAASRGTPK